MTLWRRVGRSRPAVAFAVATAVGSVLLLFRAAGALEGFELAWYDLQLQRVAAAPIAEPPISLVLITEEDIGRYGHPLPDALLRALLERLLAAGPRAVGVDLYRDQPVPAASGDPRQGTPEYTALGDLVTQDPRVVMTMKFPDPGQPGTPPPRFLSGGRQVGFSDLVVDPGGTVRRSLLFLWEGNTAYESFALQLARRYLRAEGIELEGDPENPDRVKLGPVVIPPFDGDEGPYVRADDLGYQFLLDYRYGDRPLDTYRIEPLLAGEVDPASLAGQVVIVGTAAPSVKDSFFTPLSRSRASGRTSMYGAQVHAQAVHQLLRYAAGEARPLASAGAGTTATWIVVYCLLGAAVGTWNRSLSASVLSIGLLGAALLGIGAVLFGSAVWIPVVAPLAGLFVSAAGGVAARALLERAERRDLLGLFSRFQGEEVAQEIWQRREEFVGEGGRPVTRELVLTALLADLEGYSGIAEALPAERLMEWVNDFLSATAQIVHAHGGVVDDYAGDSLKASFGFPIPRDREKDIDADAAAAVRCALAMGRRVEELNAGWRERGLPVGRCRIGVFTGPVVAGYIGSDRALKYASLGDTVNTAKRLEEFRKEDFQAEKGETSCRVLIGGETMRRVAHLFEAEPLGAHPVRGKAEPVEIFRVHGEKAG